MGIYGALATAVSGLRAQSHAMENISGNIANSQTTGYKRIETSFVDLIPDAPVKSQVPGAVTSYSRSTNGDRGDIQNASTETFMALNGSGFFVVEATTGDTSATYYTRRGDFDIDKNGYLVNGAGFRLKGLAMSGGVITGSVPEAIKIDNSFMPAKASTKINYQLNLPQLPKTATYDANVPGSELFTPWSYSTSAGQTSPAIPTGAAIATPSPAADTVLSDGDTLAIKVGSVTRNYVFDTSGTTTASLPTVVIDAQAPRTMDDILADIQADLRNNGGAGATNATLDASSGNLQVTFPGNYSQTVAISGTAGATLGINGSFTPSPGTVNAIAAGADTDKFISQSIAGGGLTLFSQTGQPVNVQMRWAKTFNTAGDETWGLFYASGTPDAWTKVGDYKFTDGVLTGMQAAPGSTAPDLGSVTVNNLMVNGTNLGAITIDHGAKGITQFADNAGTSTTTTLKQNGYGAGEFISVGVSDTGRIVASYTNGETKEVAQILVANFNAPNALKRGDGGVFTATSASGEPILSSDAGIVGSSLEASNTDISEEFTKLIVTQQAYAANTRIVSAADSMLQETLNMMR